MPQKVLPICCPNIGDRKYQIWLSLSMFIRCPDLRRSLNGKCHLEAMVTPRGILPFLVSAIMGGIKARDTCASKWMLFACSLFWQINGHGFYSITLFSESDTVNICVQKNLQNVLVSFTRNCCDQYI